MFFCGLAKLIKEQHLAVARREVGEKSGYISPAENASFGMGGSAALLGELLVVTRVSREKGIYTRTQMRDYGRSRRRRR